MKMLDFEWKYSVLFLQMVGTTIRGQLPETKPPAYFVSNDIQLARNSPAEE